MIGAFVFAERNLLLLVLGAALALYGTAHGTLEKLTANKDGIVAEFQVQTIRGAMHARTGTETLSISDSAEAKVTPEGKLTADAVLSPDEFLEVLGAVSPIHVVFEGGPNHGRDGWYPARTASIGANERVGGEVRAARGAYLPAGQLDPEGRSIFKWAPLPPDANG